MPNERACLECGAEVKGRIDKKFCDDACRTNYNNRAYSQASCIIKDVNAILRKNRKILEQLNSTGKTKISQQRLAAKGFNFSYFTSIYNTQSGKTYFFNYEQGYLYLPQGELLLVKKEDQRNFKE